MTSPCEENSPITHEIPLTKIEILWFLLPASIRFRTNCRVAVDLRRHEAHMVYLIISDVAYQGTRMSTPPTTKFIASLTLVYVCVSSSVSNITKKASECIFTKFQDGFVSILGLAWTILRIAKLFRTPPWLGFCVLGMLLVYMIYD